MYLICKITSWHHYIKACGQVDGCGSFRLNSCICIQLGYWSLAALLVVATCNATHLMLDVGLIYMITFYFLYINICMDDSYLVIWMMY